MSDINVKINVVSQKAEQSINRLAGNTKRAEKQFKGLNIAVKNSTSAFKVFLGNVGAQAFTALTRSLGGLAVGIIDSAKNFESLETQLNTLTGSATTTNKLLQELTEFAAKTPFELKDLTASTAQLLAFQVPANEVKDRLREIGEAAAASNQPIKDVALIYGQVAAAGKLTGERLLQLEERAVPIGPALAKTLGVAQSEVRDLVSKGKVDLKTFQEAFASLSAEGGQAFGALDRASQTLSGRLSTLDGNVDLLKTSIGSEFTPAVKAGVSALNDLVVSLQNDQALKDFLQLIADQLPKAVELLGNGIIFISDTIAVVQKVLNTIRAGVNSFIQVLVDGAIALNNLEIAAKRFLGIDTSGIEKQNEALKTWSQSLEEVAIESLEANEEISRSQKKVEDFVKGSVKTLVDSYNKERTAVQAVEAQTTTSNVAKTNVIKKESAEQLKAIEVNNKAIIDAEKKKQEELQNLSINLSNTIAEANLIQNEQEKLLSDERILAIQERAGTEQALQIAAQAERLRLSGETAKAELFIEQNLADQKKKLKQSEIQFESLTSKEKLNIVSGSLSQLAEATAAGGKKTFAITKALQKAQAITSGILAVQRAHESAPYPFNLVNAAAQGVIAAGNVAKINSQQAPAFEQGGIVPGTSFSGDRVQANVNSGEMILNRSQQSNLFNLANGRGAIGGQEIVVNTTVTLDEEVVGRSVSRQVANGLKLGEAL